MEFFANAQTPISSYLEHLVKTVRSSQVTIVVGTTGCGKTTRIPAALLQAGFAAKQRIVCTLPTRPAAALAAGYVSGQIGEKVGQTVGYIVRHGRCVSHQTKLLYMTDGLLANYIQQDPLLKEFSVIMIDEVHERRQQTDFLLSYLKSLLVLRPDLRLVISTATPNLKELQKYLPGAPVVNIVTRQYPVSIEYCPAGDSLPNSIMQAVVRIHAGMDTGHVLVFLPGVSEIKAAQRTIEQLKLKNLKCLPLYSRQSSEEQETAFKVSSVRKVILATNIAETSLTIDGISHVIDTGLAREERFTTRFGVTSLWVSPISQASAIQRAGRAGRTGPGTCIRLYSEASFNARAENTLPEVSRTDLSQMVLQCISRGVRNPGKLDMLTPMNPEALQFAFAQLQQWGALDHQGKLTDLGQKMARLPLTPQLARMVLLAAEEGCASDAAEAAAFLSIQNVNAREGGIDTSVNGKHNEFRDERGDVFTFLRVKREYSLRRGNAVWCRTRQLDMRLLEQVYDVRNQILVRLRAMDVPCAGHRKLDDVFEVLLRTYGGRLCVHYRNGTYRSGDLTGIQIGKYTSFSGKEPSYFIAQDLVHMGELIARYPLVVPDHMVKEVIELYGDPEQASAVEVASERKGFRAQGILRVETPFATRMVHIDMDCVRSASRSVSVMLNRSVAVEENDIAVHQLRLTEEVEEELKQKGVLTFAQCPKTTVELNKLGCSARTTNELMQALRRLGYLPKGWSYTDPDEEEAFMMSETNDQSAEEVDQSSDRLMDGFLKGSIATLSLSSVVLLRLLGGGINTVQQLIQSEPKKILKVCNGNEGYYNDIMIRLEEYGLSLQSQKERRLQSLMKRTGRSEVGELVTPEMARETIGDVDYERFGAYQSAPTRSERIAARNSLIVQHRRLLYKIAKNSAHRLSHKKEGAVEEEDLAQEAVFGAISAIALFQPLRGFRYSTYLTQWAKQAVMRFLNEQGFIRFPVHIGEQIWKVPRVEEHLTYELGRVPTDKELGEALKVPSLRAHFLRSVVLLMRSSSLDDQFSDESNSKTRHDNVADQSDSPHDLVEQNQSQHQIRVAVRQVIDDLPAKGRVVRILRLRYGLDGEDPMTLEEIGNRFGLTRERIRQLETVGMKALEQSPGFERLRGLWNLHVAHVDHFADQEVARDYAHNIAEEVQKVDSQTERMEQVRERFEQVLKSLALTGIHLRVIRLRHGLDGGVPQTLEKVGNGLGLTRQRVHAIETEVLKKLYSHEAWNEFREFVPMLKEPKVLDGKLAQVRETASVGQIMKDGLVYDKADASWQDVVDAVALHLGMAPKDITRQTRKAEYVRARWLVIVILKDHMNMSYQRIANVLGYKDHTTALYAYKQGRLLYGDVSWNDSVVTTNKEVLHEGYGID